MIRPKDPGDLPACILTLACRNRRFTIRQSGAQRDAGTPETLGSV
jgi:hypothetical protein